MHQSIAASSRPFSDAYHAAETAWFEGDYTLAARILGESEPVTKTQHADHSLLLSRTLLRAGKFADSLRAAQSAVKSSGDVDRAATALMLQGAALAKIGRLAEASKKLLEARKNPGVHRTIVAETALQVALLAYVQRGTSDKEKLAECRTWALKAVSAGSDIVLARAQELIGYVNIAEEKYGEALKSFRQALATLQSSSHRDKLLQANIVHVLASLAFERLETSLLSSALQVASELTWTDDLKSAQFQVHQNIGWLAFAAGETQIAWRAFVSARDCVIHDPTYHAMSLLNLASLYRSVDEKSAARWHLDLATEILVDLQWEQLDADHRAAFPEWVAEASRQGIAVPESALDAFERTPGADGGKSFARGDRRFKALQLTARGLATAKRNPTRAVKTLRSALEIWLAVGYRFRATTTALDLYTLTSESDYLELARTQTRNLRQGWLRDQVVALSRKESRGFANLRASERRVLQEILAGKSAAVIAQQSARSEQTIKNQTRAIFGKLGVRSRSELFVLWAKTEKI